MKRKNFFAAAVLVILLTISGCSEITPPEFNNPGDPLSPDYVIPPPGNLTASFQGPTSVSLQWYDNWNYEKGFTVERSVNGGSFEKISELPSNSEEYVDSGLDPKKSYAYRVNTFSEISASKYTRTADLQSGICSYLGVISMERSSSAAFSHDAKILATSISYGLQSENSEIKLWDAPFKLYGNYILGPYKNIQAMAFSSDDKMLAGGSADSTLYVWDVKTLALSQTIKGVKGAVNSLEFSPDGSSLAVASQNRNILIYETKSWTVVHTLSQHTGFVNRISFSKDGSLLVSGSEDGTVVLWKTSDWTVSKVINAGGSAVKSVAFRPDGQIIAAAAGMSYYQWETASGNQVKILNSGGQNALSVAFSGDGKMFAGSCGTAIAIYDSNNLPYYINYGDKSTKTFAYNTLIASPADGFFVSIGYPTILWSQGAWNISYR